MGAPRKELRSFLEELRVRHVSEFQADYRSTLGEKVGVGTVMRRRVEHVLSREPVTQEPGSRTIKELNLWQGHILGKYLAIK